MKKYFFAALLIVSVQMIQAQTWPQGVQFIESKMNDSTTVQGNLADGKIIDDLSWASSSSNACFTGLQFTQYMGHHVFYGTSIKPQSVIKIYVTAENKEEEVNIYGYMMGEGEMKMVPKLNSCITCEADYKRSRPMKFKKSSDVREIEFRNPTKKTYNIIIGVAAPKGVTERKFSLMLKTT
ncbi:MAG: hypothetical protein R2796_06540 [Chitinophagaceae bacterium]